MVKRKKLLALYFRINLAIMIGLFVLSGLGFYYFVDYIIVRELDGELQEIHDNIVAYVDQNKSLPEVHSFEEEQITYQITGKDSIKTNKRLITMYSKREKKMHNFREFSFPLKFNADYYKVTVLKPIGGLHHMQRLFFWMSLVIIFVIIVVFLFVNNLVFKKLWKPFYNSLNIFRNFNLGKDLPLDFPQTNIEEFVLMNESINTAASKAEQDYRLLKEFTENASHEIQTPLAIIHLKLDTLIQDEALTEDQREVIRTIYSPVKKLARLNKSLLLLTKIENKQFTTVDSINLKLLLQEKLIQFHELFEINKITVCETLSDAHIQANSELVDVLLNNLLSNAVNHNINNGKISISLSADKLVISNTSLQESLDKQRVFRRFYKADKHTANNGLGLSIIKQISEDCGITIAYEYSGNCHIFSLHWE
ncbi:sensor histidine kinase [Chitinophagaceae bacterium LWZ2-11]